MSTYVGTTKGALDHGQAETRSYFYTKKHQRCRMLCDRFEHDTKTDLNISNRPEGIQIFKAKTR